MTGEDADEADDASEDDDAPSLERLRTLAKDEDAEVEDPVAELSAGLEHPSEARQLVALQGLLRWVEEPRDLVEAAGVLAEESLDPLLQATALLALARAGAADWADLAARVRGRRGTVDDGPWPLRAWVGRRTGIGWPARRLAAEALGHARGRGVNAARAALAEAVARDPDWAVREAAAVALGALGAKGPAREALEVALADRRRPVRAAAARALGRTPILEPDEQDAWLLPAGEPYYRYLGPSARREYAEDLARARRRSGLNWGTFGLDLAPGQEPPADLDPDHPLVAAVGGDDALTRARDLVHHPAIRWPVDPTWPVCCGDYAVLCGHELGSCAPAGDDPEDWFLESLDPELPLPDLAVEDLEAEAEVYAFRCGRCGWWWTTYRDG